MEQLFGAIPNVINGLGANADAEEALVFAGWARCAGELLRKRTAPLEFFENRLVIAVQDEIWRRHLEYLSPQMLVKINYALGQGTLKFIEFRIDKIAVNAVHTHKHSADEYEIAELSPSLKSAANAIIDDDLREQFLMAAASYLAKQNKVS